MNEALKIFRASPHAIQLRDILSCHLGVDADMLGREANGTATLQDTAKLTVIRFLFDNLEEVEHESTVQTQSQALAWLRRQKVGRLIKQMLIVITNDTRYVYETTQASEATRQLLLAYKNSTVILYEKELKGAVCLQKQSQ